MSSLQIRDAASKQLCLICEAWLLLSVEHVSSRSTAVAQLVMAE